MDYRYFPEPDLPPLIFTAEEIKALENSIPELPLEKYHRYRKDFKLIKNDALKLSESLELSSFYETTVKLTNNPKKSANLILSVVLADSRWESSKITPEHIKDVIYLIEKGKISSSGAKDIIVSAMKNGKTAKDLMIEMGLEQVSDTDELEAWVDDVIMENPDIVEQYKAGKDKLIQFLMGQVMKKSRGVANPPVVMQILKEKLR